MKELGEFLQGEIHAGKTIYPPQEDLLLAFRTRLDKVKVVIIGQDPYHGPNQAHGLAFSVKKGVKIPPSLRNIYKEVNSDLGLSTPQSGNLESWADQGVLLLNSVLSVEQGKPNSHAGKGWEIFTDLVVKAVNNQTNPVVFMLWGAYAQKKGASIHLPDMVIKSPHPSPFSAHTGFLGSRPFSRANVFLQANGRDPINWSIPIS
jgi:uracil-DNA glycosylase